MRGFLIVKGRALMWSPAGYREARGSIEDAMLLTPPSIVRALSGGISAGAACERGQPAALTIYQV